jgi:tetratricopeptide (TPR) repeat protein
MWWMLLLSTGARAEPPDALMHLARERMRHGDYEGVRIVAQEALEQPGDHQRAAQYLVAMAYELGGEPQEAIAIYDALEGAYPRRAVPDDLRFRRAECLGRLGRVREARVELRRLPDPPRASPRAPADLLKIEVLTGVWDLQLGRQRRGYRRLARVLDGADPAEAPRYQALARHRLLADALDAAALLVFEGSDRRKARVLRERAELIQIATEQLAQLIPTEQTDLVLDGFLRLGRAHHAIGLDMLAESPLEELTPDQRAINRDLLEERVAAIWVKATLFYDRAVGLAARMDWTAEPVPTLRAEHRALLDAVDAL